ncbi:Polymerase delta-interacting protein 2 [Echinococcus granulosus]|uniref:Polymerase delta-interacting protein 2 n=1 Tax=Echinococcus granulosus TaxID=6210 RepID=W6UER2_ECHGR|nr:Polymerase delta-interacting protein 2 [Echinococcus granulosus]EUB59930.1 Polymerase delta-interacting protein 2 [Echinococcus granulosus]
MLLRQLLRFHRFLPVVTSHMRVESNSSSPYSVAPIGQLQPSQKLRYKPGQLILHRLFGYRGVVLNSWKASLYDMATITFKVDPPDDSCKKLTSMLFVHLDMDYAFHEDLIPYTCTHELPLMNPSFMELMHFDPDVEPKVYPTDRLERMMKEFGPRFEVQSVHRATTDGVRVTAVPFFMGRRKWHYLILIENMTHRGMKLCGVYWNFSYVDGRPLNEYDTDFVETPLLPVRSPFFQYHCCFQVPVPNLRARGFFRLEDVDGAAVVVDIPHLTLKDVEYYHELYISDTGSDDGPK